MSTISFKKGSKVYFEGNECEIIGATDFHNVLVRDKKRGEVVTVPIKQLKDAADAISDNDRTTNGNGSKKPFDQVSDKHWEEAKRRYEIIKPLITSERTKKDMETRGKEFNLDPVTLYRWIKKYETTGTMSSLIPGYEQRGGKGTHRIGDSSEAIISQVIEEMYLSPQKHKIKKVYLEIRNRCLKAKIPVPHENTVRKRIAVISMFEVTKRREGSKRGEELYGGIEGSFNVRHPLDVIQIDHTPLDIIVVDEIYRLPIGRPYITIAMDIFSRMVYGFYLSVDNPSFFTVGQCLYMGIMPKEEFLRKVGVIGEWDIWGLPKSMTIHIDNAKEFRGKDLKRSCEEHGISVTFRPRETPNYGGHIERIIGTLNQEIHSLQGTTFSNIQQRGDYDSEHKAVMTIKELEKWVTQFIVNVYHNKPHSSIEMTPKKKYEIGIFGDETTPGMGLPEMIKGEDARKLKISLLPAVERSIQRYGIAIDDITYYSDVLRKYIKANEVGNKKRRKFLFRVDPRDISIVYFYDPEFQDYFSIPYRNIGFPPISRSELKEIKKHLAKKNIDDYDEYDIFRAHEELKKIESQSVDKSKAVRRKHAAKAFHKTKMEEDSPVEKTIPLHKAAEKKSETVKKAIASRVEDIFANAKPFEDIEIIGETANEDE